MTDQNQDGIDDSVDEVSYNSVEDRIKAFDFARAMTLISVIEKIATVSPQNTPILGLAQAELAALNTEAKEIALARKEAAEQELQRQREEAQAAKLVEQETVEDADDDGETSDPDMTPEPTSQTATIADRNARRL